MYKTDDKKVVGARASDTPNTPLFTVITATYNRIDFLEQCLDSLFSQSYKNYEHIIIDGNSTDGTFELVKSLVTQKAVAPTRILQKAPHGVYDAINTAILEAKGKYIHLLNSDDYFADSEVLANIAKLAEKNSYPLWIQARRVQKFEDGRILRSNEVFGHQQAFIQKAVHDQIGLYNTKYKYSADREFYLRLIEIAKPLWVDIDTVIQNNHPKSLTMSGFKGAIKWVPDVVNIYWNYMLKNMKKLFGAENRT